MVREHAPRLIGQILRGQFRMTEPLLELLLMPLAIHVGVLGITLFVPFLPTQLVAALGLSVVGAHVGAALMVGRAELGDVLALLRAPLYVAWKAKLLPAIFQAASTDQEWVRTAR